MSSPALHIEVEHHIAHVRLNRPEAHNAINGAIFEGLRDYARTIIEAPGDVRAIVLSGNGKSFCAGLDMGFLAEMMEGDLDDGREDVATALEDVSNAGANRAQQVAWLWQEMPVPVIAAIHGAALGGGLNLALGADMRVVHPAAKLGFVEIDFGLLPDMSATQSLRRLLSLDRIKHLIMTGQKFSGEEAMVYGLATELSTSPVEDALTIADQIASHNPDAVRAAKSLLNESALVNVADGLALETQAMRGLLGTPNQLEAIAAHFEGRDAKFV